MTTQLGGLQLQDNSLSSESKATRLEIENAYLAQQNEHLQRELSFARYTINALKTITQQKDTSLQETRFELEKAYLRIKMLGMSMMRQQQDIIYQQQHQHHEQQQSAGLGIVEEDKPMLIMDTDSSDDQQELSDEEEVIETPRRPLSSIMTKLPLRQQPNMVFDNHHHPQSNTNSTLSFNYNL
ncbi:unnamed protein product [Cunninghamella echinulata]